MPETESLVTTTVRISQEEIDGLERFIGQSSTPPSRPVVIRAAIRQFLGMSPLGKPPTPETKKPRKAHK
jgi:hypothetical protein